MFIFVKIYPFESSLTSLMLMGILKSVNFFSLQDKVGSISLTLH